MPLAKSMQRVKSLMGATGSWDVADGPLENARDVTDEPLHPVMMLLRSL